MIKHLVLWECQTDCPVLSIKEKLEALKLEGLVSLTVYTHPLASSTCQLALDSVFENEQAMKNYANHPAHVDIVQTYIAPYVLKRHAFDVEI